MELDSVFDLFVAVLVLPVILPPLRFGFPACMGLALSLHWTAPFVALTVSAPFPLSSTSSLEAPLARCVRSGPLHSLILPDTHRALDDELTAMPAARSKARAPALSRSPHHSTPKPSPPSTSQATPSTPNPRTWPLPSPPLSARSTSRTPPTRRNPSAPCSPSSVALARRRTLPTPRRKPFPPRVASKRPTRSTAALSTLAETPTSLKRQNRRRLLLLTTSPRDKKRTSFAWRSEKSSKLDGSRTNSPGRGRSCWSRTGGWARS
ncbi:hypothetical protein AAT19DRAFT_12293 [Rhodotorula toruloides]|uniref:Uncharacterized protein n=1 Tax=Rhodotorula toruloides TaxID=5286 RepID=A0A2T0AFV5_RHOTO|nr:hypothetical protein AAT19DRAFT_12293 [Rhodotorula toruloides]